MSDNKLTNEMMLEVVTNAVQDLHFEENFERIKKIRVKSQVLNGKEISINVDVLMESTEEGAKDASFVVETGDDLSELVDE